MSVTIKMIYGQDYNVDIPHYYSIQYSEGDHVMSIEIDMRDPVPYLDIGEIKTWEQPHDVEIISKEQRERIFENVYRYLTEIRGMIVETKK